MSLAGGFDDLLTNGVDAAVRPKALDPAPMIGLDQGAKMAG